MNEARKEELKKIKEEKRKTIEDIKKRIDEWKKAREKSIEEYNKVEKLEREIVQLNQSLRIALDEHNKAVWILEEYEKIEKPTKSDKELIETQEGKNE